jgi:hypothetical protein
MAYPNFKNGPKKGLGSLGVKKVKMMALQNPQTQEIIIH